MKQKLCNHGNSEKLQAITFLSVCQILSNIWYFEEKLPRLHSYIRPRLECATTLFNGNLSKTQVEAFENVQKASSRCFFGGCHTSHSKLLHEVGIQPLAIHLKYFRLCHLYEIIHGPSPQYLNQLLPPFVNQCTRYSFRGGIISQFCTRKNHILRIRSFGWFWVTGTAGPEYQRCTSLRNTQGIFHIIIHGGGVGR